MSSCGCPNCTCLLGRVDVVKRNAFVIAAFCALIEVEAMLRLWTVEDKARSVGCSELETPAEADSTGFSSQLFYEQPESKDNVTFELLVISFHKALAPFVTNSWWRVIANVVAFEDLVCDSFDAVVVGLRDSIEYLALLQFGELFTSWLASATRRVAQIAPSKAIVGDAALAC